MSKGERKPQVPGEDAVTGPAASERDDLPAPRAGTTQLNNIAGRTANDVGVDRENVVRAQAMADAARKGVAPDLAPAADIGAPAEPTSTKRRAVINGQEVEVEVPAERRNSAVDIFGPESSYPKGTRIRADGKPCEGNEEAIGIIGDINTSQGKLVNRLIRFDQVKSAA